MTWRCTTQTETTTQTTKNYIPIMKIPEIHINYSTYLHHTMLMNMYTWNIIVKDFDQVYYMCVYISCDYGVATTNRHLKMIGLSCKRALLKRRYSAKETYYFKEPTNISCDYQSRTQLPVNCCVFEETAVESYVSLSGRHCAGRLLCWGGESIKSICADKVKS